MLYGSIALRGSGLGLALGLGSQLPPRILGRYRIVAAEGDSTPLRSEIKL